MDKVDKHHQDMHAEVLKGNILAQQIVNRASRELSRFKDEKKNGEEDQVDE